MIQLVCNRSHPPLKKALPYILLYLCINSDVGPCTMLLVLCQGAA